ncbi:phosphonate C-P lyase system protein PhnH [Vibrio methylphosphonaticus]|uniref:phosphonate C-P lyase system protein PhnH n=1 Tax=Vibrio methylphosphonaticus TaxID=2946866 RepID=UPI00202AA9E3|nr:phosphonate C-P lyase system protein PhnH [Vibrio methylphosphonaticus]MCL9775251.1 phosphonate C-P lyase system protein PhnH [Vibrio methylphosphonaticus]
MTTITPAFQDAVHDSQHCFRQLLKALSEPGKHVTLDKSHGFGEMQAAATQVLLSLADNATPVWLSPTLLQDKAVLDNVRFHSGAPIVTEQIAADFAVIAKGDLLPLGSEWLGFNQGNEEYPDQAATVIVELDSLTSGQRISLSGPGIETRCDAFIGNVPSEFLTFLTSRQELTDFPLGIDLILVHQQDVLCLPRTTHVEVSSCM